MQETQVWALGWEDPLKKGMATLSSILVWKIPWTEECGRPQTIGSQRVGHYWSGLACMPALRKLHFVLLHHFLMSFCFSKLPPLIFPSLRAKIIFVEILHYLIYGRYSNICWLKDSLLFSKESWPMVWTHSLAVWLWASYLTCLCISFPSSKWE